MKHKVIIKNILLYATLTAILFCISGCNGNSEIPNDIVLSLKDNTLSPTGMVLIITNNSNKYRYEYGEDFGIEYYENEWEAVPMIGEQVIFTIKNIIYPNKTREANINWENCYGSLPKGNYRIVKNFDKVAAFDDISDVITGQDLYYYFSIE